MVKNSIQLRIRLSKETYSLIDTIAINQSIDFSRALDLICSEFKKNEELRKLEILK